MNYWQPYWMMSGLLRQTACSKRIVLPYAGRASAPGHLGACFTVYAVAWSQTSGLFAAALMSRFDVRQARSLACVWALDGVSVSAGA